VLILYIWTVFVVKNNNKCLELSVSENSRN
jgi:hypothetical protein